MCTDFVMDTLNVNNCLLILENALNAVQYAAAASNILEKCLCLIDESTNTVLESTHFGAIGQEELRTILQRDTLTANEDTICSSVDKLAADMCTQRNIQASAANRRRVLGQARFLIRFPLLTDAQLLNGPVLSGLLSQSELLDIYHYKYAAIKPPLPFRTEPRQNVRAEGVIRYTIPDIRQLQETHTFSDPVTIRKLLWSIVVCKKTSGDSATLGFYLRCSACPQWVSWTCQVNAELRLLPWKTETAPFRRHISSMFGRDHRYWGRAEYISMEELLDPAKGYVNPTDFSLKLQIQVTAGLPVGTE
ncbi:BTB/POZ domain-containing protein 1-like [Paramacrobiotus metropolitanus]|uniref:BTB/POZ domain-containing protein 1-like n=1 Tax=Paramacrobiotus metropolitanus TaxID=2943436 RepID=UPI002445E4E9|nr:BTB/POZ domain-containing protein 1-like [Paramacrobiotus metropolitanus]